MWKIYGQTREAILIQTSSEKIKKAFKRQYPNVLAYFDEVSYKDPAYAEEISFPTIKRLSGRPAEVPGGELFPYMMVMYIKHITYEYEHEVRLVSLDTEYIKNGRNPKKGIILNFRAVPDFIEQVTVAPGVDEWFYQTVKETVARFGINCEPSRSSLEVPDGSS